MQNLDFYQQLSSLGHESGLSSNFATEYKLRVEDLSPSVNKARLHDIFAPHGKVVRVTIFDDREWLKGLNYALVSFLYQADLLKAIKVCDGLYIDGSKIKVSAARAGTNPNTASSSPHCSDPRFNNDNTDFSSAGVQYNVQSSFSSYSVYRPPRDQPRTSKSSIFSSSLLTARNQGTVREPDREGSTHTAEISQISTKVNQGKFHRREASVLSQHSMVLPTGTVRNGGAEGTFLASLATVKEEVVITTQKASLSSSSSYNTITSFFKHLLGFRSNNRNGRGSSQDLSTPENPHKVHSQEASPMLLESATVKVERNSKMSITPLDAPDAENPAPGPVLVTNHQSQMKMDPPTHEPQQTLNTLMAPAPHLPPLYTEEVADLTGQVLKTSDNPSFEGIYSFVYLGSYYGLSVAIKVLRAVSTVGAMRRKLRREMHTWWALNGHPNVLPLFGFHEDFGAFGAMISPWYTNGNSSDYLRTRWLPPAKRVELLLQVASVVAYLHAYDIIHGDLKPTNILIDDDGNARVCDFGLARLIAEYGDTGLTTTTAYTGTARYLAYELVESDETKLPTSASDVHALACVGFAFLYLDVPYAHCQGNQLTYIVRDIMKGVPPAKRPEGTTDPTITLLWDLLEAFWALDPEERPPASALAEFLIQYGKELEVALTMPF